MGPDELVNRFMYHPPQDDATKDKHELIRNLCRDLAESVDTIVPDGREKAVAITKIEEAMFWANAAIARN